MNGFYWFIVGLLVGVVLGVYIHNRLNTMGTLRIDHTNPEKDIYRIELDDFDGLSKKKHVLLQVDNNAVLSQE